MHFVFDFGRVLFDWQPAALLQRVLPQRAPDAAAAARWQAAFFQGGDGLNGDWGEFDRGTVAPAELAARIARRTGLAPHEVLAVVDAVPGALQPIAASVALLQRLRVPGRPMFYLSNMPAPYAEHLERSHGFVRGFDAGVFSARVGLIKPEAAIFDLAAQRFGVPPHTLLFLDDHAPNVEAARAAGWQALVFADAAQCERDLRAAGWWPAAAEPARAPEPR